MVTDICESYVMFCVIPDRGRNPPAPRPWRSQAALARRPLAVRAVVGVIDALAHSV
jgi:hypothetical protein